MRKGLLDYNKESNTISLSLLLHPSILHTLLDATLAHRSPLSDSNWTITREPDILPANPFGGQEMCRGDIRAGNY